LREVEYRLNNRTPTAHPVSNAQDPQTGVITGNLNATDLDGDPLTYTVTTSPTHGGVTVHSDGSYTYTPDADFALSGGTDTVRVQIREANAATHLHGITGLFADIVNALGFGQAKLSDGSTTTAVLQFVVTPIAAVNHAPVAPTTQGAVTYDPITGVATGNLGFTDPDSDPLTYTVTTTPAYGSVTVATNGTYTYTPTDAGRAQAATTPGLTDAFAVTASDGQLTAPTTVTITVTADLPVAHPDSYTIGQDTTLNITSPGILANDVDPDGDSVVYVRNITDPKHGTLGVQTGDTNPPGGGFTYTPNPGFWGTDTFTYAASDQAGHIGAPTTVTITVTPALVGPVSIGVGINPEQVVVTPDGSTVYVTNNGRFVSSGEPHVGDSVSVISTATNTVTSTIQVGRHPSGLAITPDGSTVYVTNFDDYTVSVISTATNTVIATIPVGGQPYRVVVTADGSRALVANRNTEYDRPANLSVIDTATNTVVSTVGLGSSYPSAVVANSDGSVIYVTDQTGSYTLVIDGGALEGGVYTGGQYPGESTPVSAVLDGDTLYVADRYSSTVKVVDLSANDGLGAITARIGVPGGVAQIVRSLDGSSLYIGGGNTISRLDVATGAVTTLATFTDAIIQGIALSPDGTVLYATNPGTSNESDDAVLVVHLT